MMDGKKMSTRAGKTVKLDEVLTEAIEKAKKLGEKLQSSSELVKKVFMKLDKKFYRVLERFIEEGNIDAFPKKGKKE